MAFSVPDRLLPGKPYPLGATSDGLGVNFAVFSAHAERIELCLFDPRGRKEMARMPLPECTDEIWHGYLPEAVPGMLYGYRAHGPYQPERGHRFNPAKLLIDPYARQLSTPLMWGDAVFGYRINGAKADLSMDKRDSAALVPKSVVVDDCFNWSDDVRPNVPWSKTVIYEAHVRGLSMLNADTRQDERGTFAALAEPSFIEYLLKLGVTTLELMPVHAFVQDRHLLERGLRNYWGYNTLAFFAPEPAYLATGQLDEIRRAVRKLHAAGIEVILDVVYNHTACGSEMGPTLSFRGLDNASYYRLLPDNPRYYINETGCGNTLNIAHPRVLQMVLDSLRYWVESFHIDGFRFDLGVTLGREPTGFDPGSGFFDAILQDPVLSRVKLISEPWDVGPGGYQLGNHPPGFAEWNDKFRDDVRRYWRGDEGMRNALARRLAGSAEMFNHRHRKPWASINYVASHDGFTLEDVVSYNEKHNEANGEGGADGHSENHSCNWGVEGKAEDGGIKALRDQIKRAMLATTMFSHGTPMILCGDEFGRTQNGNNNAYCQDNELSWTDWANVNTPEGQVMAEYVALLTAVRRNFLTLQAVNFLRGEDQVLPGIGEIGWFDENGVGISDEAWQNPHAAAMTMRRAVIDTHGQPEIVLMMINGCADEIEFSFPEPVMPWFLLVDSFAGFGRSMGAGAEPAIDGSSKIRIPGRSLKLFANRPLTTETRIQEKAE